MAFPVNILSAEWREVKQVVGHKKAVQAPSIRGVRVEQVISLLVEDTQARMLALEWLFHRLVLASLSAFRVAKVEYTEGNLRCR